MGECSCYYVLITATSDLCDALAVIHDLVRWKQLGLQLGLLYPSLKSIDHEQRGNIDSCRMEMLSAWLQQQDNVTSKGVPSWSVLRAALKRMGAHSWLTGSATDGEYSIIVTSAVCQYPSTAGTQCSQCLVSSSQCSTSPPPPTQLYSTSLPQVRAGSAE